MKAILRVASALTLAGSAFAQTPHDTGTTLIHAGRLFDSPSGTFLPSRDILVRNGRVADVGEHITLPAGAREIDLRRYTVLPRLIDAHTHLLYLEEPSGDLKTQGTKAVIVEGTPAATTTSISGGRRAKRRSTTSSRTRRQGSHRSRCSKPRR